MSGMEMVDPPGHGGDPEPGTGVSGPRMKPMLTSGYQRTPRSVWERRTHKRAQAHLQAQQRALEQAEEEGQARAALPEWHTLTPSERDTAWAELVDWVTWLHDRYELGIEERLPRCWAQHPGLIEELRALRAWRLEIYQNPAASGQAARYWHAELRQTINAAGSFYASGCRAGHYGSATSAFTDTGLQNQWKDADHLAGIPPTLITINTEENATSRTDSDLFLTTATMGTHRLNGEVAALSQTIHDFVRYDDSWWTRETDGWLRITDPQATADLDARAAALALADASVHRHKTGTASTTATPPEGRQ